MKKVHPLISIAVLLLITYLLGLFALHIYAGQRSIPNGVMVGGLPIGGLAPEDALALLDQRLLQLEQQSIVYQVNGTKVQTTIKHSGITYHTDDLRTAVASLSQGGLWKRMTIRSKFPKTWQIHAQITSTELQSWFSPTWEQENLGIPVDATRTIGGDDSVHYTSEQAVQRIDWGKFTATLHNALPTQIVSTVQNTIHIDVPLKSLLPKVTLASLKAQGIERKIATYTTSAAQSSEGRVHNLSAVVRSIDGMLLAPNEIFDYEKVIDTAEFKYGFRPAPVILGGKLVTGIGGGVCQISSTLYNAAVQAGLEVIERRNHSLPVRYVPKGQDATFAKGYINFRFKNTSEHYILIKASSDHGVISIKLFGDIPKGVQYYIETKQIKSIPAPIKYVVNQKLSRGQKEIIAKGKEGYIVDSYRIKKVDGTVTEKKKLFRDTYPATPSIIAIPPY